MRLLSDADLLPLAGISGGLSSIRFTSIMEEVEDLGGRNGCRAFLGAGTDGGATSEAS